ncbi:MAG TPA: pilus assembly protein PilM, partial [Candidatus Omnitrophota bacterium]|nr:pilus assembly protein PilM [Candidatus Omnitrophota bacterium]
MALTKQLGLFWGENALYFSENSESDNKMFSIPLKKKVAAGNLIQIQDESLEDNRILITDIQKAFKEHKVSSSTVNLSLPTKDIIFRSFSIPWMPPNEMRQVVEFEAAKYLPFSLTDLAFAFHPVVITHNNTKRIRIIFVAIKKSVLEKYKYILTESLLNVDLIEPAPVGLLRTLNFKKHLSPKDQFAIVEKEGTLGKITIIDDGIPQFVRDFNLRISASDQEEISSEVLITRLVNEIQVSLDYFNRIGNPKEISQILFLTTSDSEEISNELSKNLEMKVAHIYSSSVLAPEFKDIGFLNAFGIALNKDVAVEASFDLSNRKRQALEFNLKTLLKQMDIRALIPLVGTCLGLIIASPILSNTLIKMAANKSQTLKEKLGIYESMDEALMTEKTKG